MTSPTTQEHQEHQERFIPIGKHELVDDLLAAPHWQPAEKKQFGDFCQLIIALYHYKFHKFMESLKRCYYPFNPDTDLVSKHIYTEEEKQSLQKELLEEIRQLLTNANYEELTVEQINQAMTAASYYGVEVEVDLDDYAEIALYYRGATTMTVYHRTWTNLFIFKKPFEIPIYRRLLLVIKFKTTQERVKEIVAVKGSNYEKKALRQVRRSRKELPQDLTEKQIFIKLFKNLPRSDLKMLFPNQHVRLKLFDKIKLILTGGGGTLFGLFSVVTKASIAFTNPIAFIGAFFGLIGIIFRQIMSIFIHRTQYMMTLSRNLYFHNLDNNFGVINSLVDMAEEEECKEAILAYYFIHTNPDKKYTQKLLDQEIENYIQEKYEIAIDFEVEDGLRKLKQEGLLKEEQGILTVLNLSQACTCLDKQWDEFFTYNQNQMNGEL
jgi:hypothetical protein